MSFQGYTIGSPSRAATTMDTRSAGYGYRPSSSSGFRSSQSWSSRSPAAAAAAPMMMSSASAYGKRSVNAPVSRAYGSVLLGSSVEKEQLQGLNDRFAGYIDKVHCLEQQNQQIEAEIAALRQRQASRGQLGDAYDAELRELRATLEQLHRDKAQAQLDAEHLEEDARRLRERGDEEARVREETEAIVRVLQRDAGDCELARGRAGEEGAGAARGDRVHPPQPRGGGERAGGAGAGAAARVPGERRADAGLPEERHHRGAAGDPLRAGGHSSQNLQQVEQLFMCRYSKLTEAAEHNKDAISAPPTKISDYTGATARARTVELEVSAACTRDIPGEAS
ncbi:hypothetical protein CRUP_015559 [Coryphaenoides rupestris]|nr:hypothetical protein CRUP_015559 [Coryphaenoides rupestris]